MKIIDLLNKIANGKQPKAFEYNKELYIWEDKDKWYISEPLLNLFYIHNNILNDEIEIIEETNENKISPDDVKNLGRAIGNLQRLFESGYEEGLKEPKKIKKINRNRYIGTDIDMTDDILDKLDEIIDYINKGDNNE